MVPALLFALVLVGERPASALRWRCCREFGSNLCVVPHCHHTLLSQLRCIIFRTDVRWYNVHNVKPAILPRASLHVAWSNIVTNEMLIAIMVLPPLSRFVKTQC
jgi:hypothetical protein